MKVLALGGAGDMGRMGVTTMINFPAISSVTVADRNIETAQAFLNLAGSEKLRAVKVDIADQRGLVDLISKHDLVLSTVGPYFRFGKMVVEACLKAQKPGVDIGDDWKPMLEVLDLKDQAEKAEVTFIAGMGSSPGLLNLMSVLACQGLDEIDEVVTAWGLGAMESGKKPNYYVSRKHLVSREALQTNAAVEHMIHECVGKIPTFRDGKIIEIDALTETKPVKFPGFKEAYACHIGHPEPLTLPRTLRAKTISNVMFFGRNYTEVLRNYAKKIGAKEMTVQEAAKAFEKEHQKIMGRPDVLEEISGYPPTLNVTATGLKDKQRKKIAIGLEKAPYGQMAGITSIPMAIAGLMILEGRVKKKGVLTPEESIEPVLFFNRYAEFCGQGLKLEDVLIRKEMAL